MAGLVAAYELQRAGHEVTLLEAQQRVGGRVETLRAPFSEGLYAEAGAMRIPKTHLLTLAYVDKFALGVSALTPYSQSTYYYLRGKRHLAQAADADPGSLGFELAESERGSSLGERWEQALEPVLRRLHATPEGKWPELFAEYDRLSIRGFLRSSGWSDGAIEMFGVLFNQESLLDSSFLELLQEEAHRCYENLVHIDGGMDRLPRAFLPSLEGRIRFGARVVALEQDASSVTVYYETLAQRGQVSGDYAIITVPFSVLRHLDVLQPFSRGKAAAIRELHYDASVKVFLQCGRRFWEQDEGIHGGRTVTDLPARAIYYPEHDGAAGRGVLLASYTWGEDAQRWGALAPQERIVEAVHNVAQIHPQLRAEFECGASKVWQDDPYAAGAFAAFNTGQYGLLYRHIVAPEGRLHFAGEHASLNHAWIQGAIHSGLRAAAEVHRAG